MVTTLAAALGHLRFLIFVSQGLCRFQAWQVQLEQLKWAAFLQSIGKTAKKVMDVR